MNALAMLQALGNLSGVTTAEIVYRAARDNSLCKHIVKLGESVEGMYVDDIAKLQEMIPALSGLELEAANAILASRQKSLQVGIGHNPDYTCEGVYVHLDGLSGVKAHKDTGVLYVSGRSLAREVIEEGTPLPPVNSKPLTVAKRKIEKGLTSSKFRQFILKNVKTAEVFGTVLKVEAEG
jgi:hypothetical protein